MFLMFLIIPIKTNIYSVTSVDCFPSWSGCAIFSSISAMASRRLLYFAISKPWRLAFLWKEIKNWRFRASGYMYSWNKSKGIVCYYSTYLLSCTLSLFLCSFAPLQSTECLGCRTILSNCGQNRPAAHLSG